MTEDALLDADGVSWIGAARALGGSVEPLRPHVAKLFRGRTRYTRAARMSSPLARAQVRSWCSDERLALIEIVHQLRAHTRAERVLREQRRAA